MTFPARVRVVEVGPRDGLQNEPEVVPSAVKIQFIERLAASGLPAVEATSFVSPGWIPQLADAAEVFAGLRRRAGVSYPALVPNLKGLERALAAGVEEIAVFTAASETFNRKNINASIDESLARIEAVAGPARAQGLRVRGYVSCVVECPYDGSVAPEAVCEVAEALFAMGCYEVSLGDTIGKGTPTRIAAMLDAVLGTADAGHLAGHYHDTGGRALDNIEVSLGKGLRVFDAAVGGLGGCPFAPGAAGNVATEAVHDRLLALGYETGLDREVLAKAAAMAQGMRGRTDA